MPKKITTKTKFSEILAIGEDAASILFENGLYCIGCPMAMQETLEQGCIAHGMNKKQIDKLIKELKKNLDNYVNILKIVGEEMQKERIVEAKRVRIKDAAIKRTKAKERAAAREKEKIRKKKELRKEEKDKRNKAVKRANSKANKNKKKNKS